MSHSYAIAYFFRQNTLAGPNGLAGQSKPEREHHFALFLQQQQPMIIDIDQFPFGEAQALFNHMHLAIEAISAADGVARRSMAVKDAEPLGQPARLSESHDVSHKDDRREKSHQQEPKRRSLVSRESGVSRSPTRVPGRDRNIDQRGHTGDAFACLPRMLSVPERAVEQHHTDIIAIQWYSGEQTSTLQHRDVFPKARQSARVIRYDAKNACFQLDEVLRFIEQASDDKTLPSVIENYLRAQSQRYGPHDIFPRPLPANAILEARELVSLVNRFQPLIHFAETHSETQLFECVVCQQEIHDDTDQREQVQHIATHIGGIWDDVELVRCHQTGCNIVGDRKLPAMVRHWQKGDCV
ncbi:hypothetical protein C7974DRAFT_208185 [Boeremia exigua]|uniref:uncharacterized protein n=1 Tax=Boeremia exigua TaxID=749465 RepID=UPI001E8CA063|nr:uncharacterized protein C7974DRAFT_208185 [Boeremia exigua]KAH6625829.1 hypothetical protein C7974DRAFT_208185 [Boeremia exigua]